MSNKQFLRKMKSELQSEKAQYFLGEVPLNCCVGQQISLKFTGNINCIHCGRGIKKTFNQGYCYPCFQKLAQCDICIVKPERCHFDKGTCREEDWGKKNCFIPHIVYLSCTSGLKVGITKYHNRLTRWVDQGAEKAAIVAKVENRKVAGVIEVLLKKRFDDKTNWRNLLLGKVDEVDLSDALEEAQELLGMEDFSECLVDDSEEVSINYPVQRYLEKAKTHNLDKTPKVQGVLHGIKGQYLFIGEAGLNIRKYQGYEVVLSF